jgi:hypothetical protein
VNPSAAHTREQVNLAISPNLLSDEAIHRLIEEWIVPALVERYLIRAKGSPKPADPNDNKSL